MKKLTEIFNIQKGDIVSIVGSGGKTSLLFKLAQELKNDYNVLISTSTRLKIPKAADYDYLYYNLDSYIKNKNNTNKGITVISKDIDINSNKLIGINEEILNILKANFDIVLLEADGSKKLPLKGWKSYEPPVLEMTTKTIGVMPVNLINKKVDKDFIYGFDEFNILTDFSEYISFEAIGKICSRDNGLFKNSKGQLYLFLNKADNCEDIKNAKKINSYFKQAIINRPYNFKIIYGSLKNGMYYEE